MKKYFYWSYWDAKRAAESFAEEYDGIVESASTDSVQMNGAEYDEKSLGVAWVGETGCFNVEDKEGAIIGIFAYWV